MLPSTLWSFLFLSGFSSIVCGQSPVQTLFPAAVPLAVKSPYMSVWYQSLNISGPLSNSSPLFWGQQAIMGWSGKIRVNGTTYKWLGQDNTGIAANVTNIQITPTRTIFVMRAGPMNVTVTFLTPVEPDDWVKQSIPFSYVSVEAQSVDGNSYPVQVYSDISAEWASGDRTSLVRWSNTNTGKSIYHEIELQNPKQNVEIANQAQDGKVYYAISTSQTSITWQIDLDSTTRNAFQTNGILRNDQSNAFASISPNLTVFALAINLGTIQSTSSPVTWSVGYVRNPSITYTMPNGAIQQRRPYYVTQYSDIADAIDAFTGDYAGAHDRAVALDQKVMNAAAKISSQYSDIVSLATRQTMSALDITVGTDSSQNLVPDDVKIFMKNLGTDGRVSPPEHVYAAFPMFLYLNASIGGALLQPLFELQASRTGQLFAAQDIGDTYPVVSGPSAVAQIGVEETGNMLIMLLAHARISGDGTLLSQYYNATKRWADYLVSNALNSQNQTNQDGNAVDLTNIALKGIIGVKVMAEIAHALGEDFDAAEYGTQASSLLNSFLSRAASSGGSRLLGNYGDQQSWSLMYNIFADKLLGLNFVPQSVIDQQTQFISSLLATASHWGLPIDNTTPYGNAAWTLFTSAFVSDTTVRDSLIKAIYNHANFNQSVGVFPERYYISNNSARNGFASPPLGGLFCHLALTVPNKTISAVSESGNKQNGGSRSSSHVGAIVGGVIGGLAIIGIVVATVIFRKRRKQQHEEADKVGVAWHHLALSPYHQSPTAGFADNGTGERGAHLGPSANVRYSSSTNMAHIWDAYEDSSTVVSHPPAPLSSKTRKIPFNRTHRPVPSVAASSDTGSQTSRDLLVPGGPGSTLISRTEVLGLRAEVDNLRQVVREIRAERFEPPPEYVEE